MVGWLVFRFLRRFCVGGLISVVAHCITRATGSCQRGHVTCLIEPFPWTRKRREICLENPFYNENLLKYKALNIYIELISTQSRRSSTLLSKSRYLVQSPSLNPNPEV